MILESAPESENQIAEFTGLTPFVFSASSESALQRLLASYSEHIKTHPEINLADLAWTLRARRSALPVKVALSALSLDELQNAIHDKLESIEKKASSSLGIRSSTGKHAILGVFTGQGAQWPRYV